MYELLKLKNTYFSNLFFTDNCLKPTPSKLNISVFTVFQCFRLENLKENLL